MVDISNIIKVIEHVDNVSVRPEYLNADILSNLFSILKHKVENRCNRVGYILEVIKLVSISYGVMPPENFDGNVIVEVVYLANTCIPKENDIIEAKVQLVPHIVCSAGPLLIYAGNNSSTIKKDDIVKILILKVILNYNDHNIKAWGTIL